MRAGVIRNPNAYRNRGRDDARAGDPDVLIATPGNLTELAAALKELAAQGVNLLVIEGGDGTIRDVLTLSPGIFPQTPRMAIVPAGKTNALALDLGARPGFDLEAALAAAADPARVKQRFPIEVFRTDEAIPSVRGFIFGAGAFVRATQMAQSVHRMKMIDSLAVALAIGSAAVRTLFGGPRDPWRVGADMTLALDDDPGRAGARFLLLASTLKRFPLGLKPFGPIRDGLKLLEVDAPPRHLHWALAPVMMGAEPGWLARGGYRRTDPREVRLSMPDGFVLDGETYAGGDLTLRPGDPITFVAP